MRCMSPDSVPALNDQGRKTKSRITVPCGKCPACLSNKRTDWSFRLRVEMNNSQSGWFVTLTYNEDQKVDQLSKTDLSTFIRRLRHLNADWVPNKTQSLKVSDLPSEGAKIRFYGVGEYGSKTFRPHYHILVFNLPGTYEEAYQLITKAWKKGFVKIYLMEPRNIHYVTKYMINKSVIIQDKQKPFSQMSLRPGIGYQYLEKMYNFHKKNNIHYVIIDGRCIPMPRYYKDRIFDQWQKLAYNRDMDRKAEEQEIKDFKNAYDNSGGNPFEYKHNQDYQIRYSFSKRNTKTTL